MTTKTDFNSILELKDKFTPKHRGIVTGTEMDLIFNILEIKSRTNIELQNIRDMVVMVYGGWANKTHDLNEQASYFDKMSAITSVIDHEKWTRGMEV